MSPYFYKTTLLQNHVVLRINSSFFSVFSLSSCQESLIEYSIRISNSTNKLSSFYLPLLNCGKILTLPAPADPLIIWTNMNPETWTLHWPFLNGSCLISLNFHRFYFILSFYKIALYSSPSFLVTFFHIGLNPCGNLSKLLQLPPLRFQSLYFNGCSI